MEKHDPNSCRVCLANRPKEKTPQQLAAREEMQKPALAAIAQREARQEALYRRVAEQKKRERDSKVPVFLTIGVFFDGTCNNASNTAMGIMCGAHHPIQPQDLETSCKPYMADADSSYGNDLSNVAKLHDLYHAPIKLEKGGFGEPNSYAYRKIYVNGIGTVVGEKDSKLGSSLGRGETGVAERVQSVFVAIGRHIRDIYKQHPNNEITHIMFDVFGFSRGAAAARHFATEVAKARNGPFGVALNSQKIAFSPEFIGQYKKDIRIGFIGLFDTVAATGGLSNLLNISSSVTPGLNIALPSSDFSYVVQLVARDECRDNFALNKIGPDHPEIIVPGVHSDVGGGYRAEADECVLITPMQALTVAENCDVKTTSIYQDALQAKLHMIAKGWPAEMLEIITPPSTELAIDPQDRQAPREKRVFAGLQLKRTVRGELSRVYLRVMYTLAKHKKVRFTDIDEQRADYKLPQDLQSLCDRFVAGDYSTTPAEEAQLKLRYIHTSAHWNNPVTKRHGEGLKLFYFNAPTENGIRIQHPHVIKGQR
ncbi:DUF2235 domain-containing protein [Pseudomonas sp. RTI1]|uniref:T6SS phospholipase effector Tle1-like catalytic domain-containing protein n=1 Tax=unclassified Pseudomonas TaxID=196821 RepID=UPI002B23AE07|nr:MULTISPECIES: DUF2235 domain-containing protein [unclassified Pseudomonas]MEA9995315.1 DUF2235 domain-containing protein [Pseudomonas sp. AA4]MEB0087219.1 DUF2235 domain-containing protein [Pseudomonas sp. RTI1]MEB0153514.1 DUF2235 domain-containing protein [Pseudomonas sp. CCC4.3]MEB0219961.1 DUF2235 domain-containing protein [Pseudomonas sp. AB12(2023)]